MTIEIGRRELIAGAFVAATAATPALAAATAESASLYGLVGKLRALPGKRDELIYHILDGAGNLPGCLSYIVATDPDDPDLVWITEAWDSEESHKASLGLRAVRQAIAKARPLIATFEPGQVTRPVGGLGLRG